MHICRLIILFNLINLTCVCFKKTCEDNSILLNTSLNYNLKNMAGKNFTHILWVLSDFRGTDVNLLRSRVSMSSLILTRSRSILSISLPIFSVSAGGSPLSMAQSKCIYLMLIVHRENYNMIVLIFSKFAISRTFL